MSAQKNRNAEIKRLFDEGYTVAKLAAQFGISRARVQQIVAPLAHGYCTAASITALRRAGMGIQIFATDASGQRTVIRLSMAQAKEFTRILEAAINGPARRLEELAVAPTATSRWGVGQSTGNVARAEAAPAPPVHWHTHAYTGNESSKRLYCACGKWILGPAAEGAS